MTEIDRTALTQELADIPDSARVHVFYTFTDYDGMTSGAFAPLSLTAGQLRFLLGLDQ